MIRLAVRCPPELAEAVLAELLVLAPGGVEEDEGSDYVEYAIYGAPGEVPDLGPLRATVLRHADAKHDEETALIEVASTEVPDDWAEKWTDFHKPVVICDRVRVRPSWEPEATDGMIDIVVDPGQAFGTGAHPTTRLCIEFLLELADEGRADGAAADWGTGSGVLAIAAAKLGWNPVSGCDHELAALDAARANAEANGVVVELSRINLRKEPPPTAPTAIANLTSPVLVEIAPRLGKAAGEGAGEAPAVLVCSGMLAAEVDSIAMAMRAAGFTERERRESGEWGALLLEHE